MGVPARKYIPLAQSLAQQGFIVSLCEWRGLDSSNMRASRKVNFGYNEKLLIDLPVALEKVQKLYPNNPVYILGHSLGGQLGTLFMCQYPQVFSGFVGIATGTPYYKGWQFPMNYGLLLSSKLMRFLAVMVGHFPGYKLGFAGREARQLIKDWSKTVASGKYKIANNKYDYESICKTLNIRALMITIDDDILAPPASIKNLGNKLANSEVEYQHLVSKDFPSRKTGHFAWMKDSTPIAQSIKQWIK